MKKLLLLVVLLVAAFGFGLLVATLAGRPKKTLPDPPALVTQVRELARLETLAVAMYKKVTFSPEPKPADSFFGDVASWAKFTLARPEGKAIVFAEGHIGVDLEAMTEGGIVRDGEKLKVKLPGLKYRVELEPGETEVIGSNLSSQETADLMAAAKGGFLRQLENDHELKARAYRSAESSLRALFLSAGFEEVTFERPARP